MNPYRRDTFLKGMLAQAHRFIGPQDELEWLLAQISEDRPAGVSLVGPWGIGKSFLLTFLAAPEGARRTHAHMLGPRFAEDPERLLFVSIDLEDSTMMEQAKQHFMSVLYERVLSELGKLLNVADARLLPLDQVPETPFPSVEVLRSHVQRALRLARNEADDAELRERFEAVLGSSFPDKLIALLRRLDRWCIRVVFLIDDFDTVVSALTQDIFDHLRELLSYASVIVTTRQALSELVPSEIASSPFFTLLQRINLMSLHFMLPEEARRMITEPPTWFEHTQDFRFSDSDVAFILELTGFHPDLIRVSCETLYMRYRRRRSPPQVDILPPEERPYVRALLRTTFADFFAVLWHQMSGEEQALLMRLATEDTGLKAADVTLSPTLSALITRGYVVYDAGRYRLFAGLFSDYVREQAVSVARPEPDVASLQLTDMEQKFIDFLKARPGMTAHRDEIVAALYAVQPHDEQAQSYYGRLDALIFRLRNKLGDGSMLIENIRKHGYRLVFTR
jgi:hypothetical protein